MALERARPYRHRLCHQKRNFNRKKIPVWAIQFIEYGETDDLTPDEERIVRLFLKSFPDYEGLCFDYQGDHYFSYDNDVDGLGGDVIDAVVYGHYKMVDDNSRSYGPQGDHHA
jgi:hypothetical protein